MPPRRSHPKSRRGCKQCKLRRVKCDEQHPVCSNCSKRGSECSYVAPPDPADPSPSHASRPHLASGIAQRPSKPSSSSHRNDDGHLLLHRPHSATHELGLMHQWTLSTYASLGQSDNDRGRLRSEIARISFDHVFLLNALFSMTSLHLAFLEPQNALKHGDVAVSYQDQALQLFREVLLKPTAQQCPALFWASVLIGITAFALPRIHPTSRTSDPIDALVNLSRLLSGCGLIIEMSKGLMGEEAWEAVMPPDPPKPLSQLDDQALVVFDQLKVLAKKGDETHPGTPVSPTSGNLAPEDDSEEGVYVKSVTLLKHFYEICQNQTSQTLAWPVVVGASFTTRLESRDPLAVLITMCYGVLLLVLDERWWAEGSGRQLVQSVSHWVRSERPEWSHIAAWAERKAGLHAQDT